MSTASRACAVWVASWASRWTRRSVSSAISGSVGRRPSRSRQAPPGSLPWIGYEKDLERGVRKDDGADVAPIHHEAVVPGQAADRFVDPSPDRRHLRDP